MQRELQLLGFLPTVQRTAFYLNGEGWAIGDGMWTMSAVVWTDGDDSDDEIPYDTSSSDE